MVASLAVRRVFQSWAFRAIVLTSLVPLVVLDACSLAVDVEGLSNGPLAEAGRDHDVDPGSAIDSEAGAATGNGDASIIDGAYDATAESGAIADAGDGSAVHDAVASESSADGSKCAGDLSNVGAGDFHVIFILTTTQNALAPLVNQRDVCSPAVFWDVRQNGANLQVEVDDKAHFNAVTSGGAAINDGAPHVVVIERVSGTLTVQIDGANRGSVGSDAVLSALPPLAAGTDVCQGKDGTVAFTGSLASVCVTNL